MMQKCPVCQRESQQEYRPFCCRRCADIDLGRWFSETYRIGSPLPDDEITHDDARPDCVDE